VKGQLIKTLANDNFTVGTHKVTWNGTDNSENQVASGVYFYKIIINLPKGPAEYHGHFQLVR
jgi:flagellar hook assembly protein FlgD